MTLNQLVKDIAAMEGKKVAVSVGNIREVLMCLYTLEAAYRIKDSTELGEVFHVLDKQVKKQMKKVKNG